MPDTGSPKNGSKKNGWLRVMRRERGQSMVEFALVLPLFLTIVFAVVEIGRAFATKQALTIAAREGARVLILPYGAGLSYKSESAVQTAAVDRVKSYLGSSGVTTGIETKIRVARVAAGNDGTYGTPDDAAPEYDYSQGVRGQRVGIVIEHNFESPVPFFVRMFESPQPQGAAAVSTGIRMSAACYMDHE